MTETVCPYVLTISDGHVIRSVYPSRLLPSDRVALDAIVAGICAGTYGRPGLNFVDIINEVDRPQRQPTNVDNVNLERPATSTMTQAEIAKASGYSGNTCQTCGSFAMKRTGTCETCESCGGTSGGCS